MIVPGLAVRSYAEAPAAALRAHGHEVELLRPPAWRGEPTDVRRYGLDLARRIEAVGLDLDLLVGLSVGTQAAAVAAASTAKIKRLLLVSPTVDPARRGRLAVIKGWLLDGDDHRDSPSARSQLPDWAQAGVPRIYRGLVGATRLALENVLPEIAADVTLVHTDSDLLSPLDFAVDLAERSREKVLVMPDAPHSWPIADGERFCQLVHDLV